jgi:hypothetical protein
MSTEIERITNTPIIYNVTEEGLAELERRWEKIPDCSEKDSYEIVRVGIRELVGLRNRVEDRRKELKRDAIDYGEKEKEKLRKIQAEQDRINNIRQKIELIKDSASVSPATTSEDVRARIGRLEEYEITEDGFQEFEAEASITRNAALSTLRKFLQDLQEVERRREEERLERERLDKERREFEERQRAEREEREREERERAERIRREEEERDRKRREEEEALAAERAKLEEERRAQEEEREKREREAAQKAAKEREAQEAKRREEEARLEEERKAIEEEKRLLRAEAEERERIERARIAEEERIEEEERRALEEEKRKAADEEERKRMIEESVEALSYLLREHTELREVIQAIIEGKVPHVKFTGGGPE